MIEVKLTKIGDDLGLVLDQKTMDKLKITGNCELDLSVECDSLIIQRADTARKKRIDEGLNKIDEQYGDTLKKLGEE